jgi:hypothetical protein
MMTVKVSPPAVWAVGAAATTMNELGNVRNRAWRNGDAVVGDGMFGISIVISREISASSRPLKLSREVRASIVVMTVGNQTGREQREAGKWMREDHANET